MRRSLLLNKYLVSDVNLTPNLISQIQFQENVDAAADASRAGARDLRRGGDVQQRRDGGEIAASILRDEITKSIFYDSCDAGDSTARYEESGGRDPEHEAGQVEVDDVTGAEVLLLMYLEIKKYSKNAA